MVAPCRWFTNQPILALKFLRCYVHRSTLPQLRCAQQLPQRVSRETSPHNANHPPAGCCVSGRVIFWLCVGGCFAIQPGTCKTVGVAGDFHRPYETLNVLVFTIQRTTLPQSRFRSAAPSEREPGGAVPFIVPLGNRKGAGDFHRPYEGSEGFTFCFFILPGLWLWQVCCGAGG